MDQGRVDRLLSKIRWQLRVTWICLVAMIFALVIYLVLDTIYRSEELRLTTLKALAVIVGPEDEDVDPRGLRTGGGIIYGIDPTNDYAPYAITLEENGVPVFSTELHFEQISIVLADRHSRRLVTIAGGRNGGSVIRMSGAAGIDSILLEAPEEGEPRIVLFDRNGGVLWSAP